MASYGVAASGDILVESWIYIESVVGPGIASRAAGKRPEAQRKSAVDLLVACGWMVPSRWLDQPS